MGDRHLGSMSNSQFTEIDDLSSCRGIKVEKMSELALLTHVFKRVLLNQ